MATDTKTAPAANKTTEGKDIPKSPFTSAITTDLPNKTAPAANKTTEEKDIPKTSLTSAITTDLPNDPVDAKQAAQDQKDAVEAMTPAAKASIGLVKVDGGQCNYVGVAPGRDKDPETPGGIKITTENSTFTPISEVPFSNSIKVKDPKSGEFYFPADKCTSWADCELNGSKLF